MRSVHTGCLLLVVGLLVAPAGRLDADDEDEPSPAQREVDLMAARFHTIYSLAQLHAARDKAAAAAAVVPVLEQAVARFDRWAPEGELPDDHLELALLGLGTAHVLLAQPDAARPRFARMVDLARRRGGEVVTPELATALSFLAQVQADLGRPDLGLPLADEAVRGLATSLREGEDRGGQALVAIAYNARALCLGPLGRAAEAERDLVVALAAQRRADPHAPAVLRMVGSLAGMRLMQGRSAEAEAIAREALATEAPRPAGAVDLDRALVRGLLGAARIDRGDLEGGAPDVLAADAAFRRWEQDVGHPHPYRVRILGYVGQLRWLQGRFAEAIAACSEALRMARALRPGAGDLDQAQVLVNLGQCELEMGLFEEGRRHCEEALAMLDGLGIGPSIARAYGENALALAASRDGEAEAAIGHLRRALAAWEGVMGSAPRLTTLQMRANLIVMLANVGRADEAAETLEATRAWLAGAPGLEDARMAVRLSVAAAAVRMARGDADGSARDLERALDVGRAERATWRHGTASDLGWILLDQGRAGEALGALRTAIEALDEARREVGGAEEDRLAFVANLHARGAHEGMVRVQLALGRPQDAFAWAEEGRAQGMRELLERGRRLRGGDVIELALDTARAERAEERVAILEQARAEQVATETALAREVAALRALRREAGEPDADFDARRRQHLEALERARTAARDARRRAIGLVGDLVTSDVRARPTAAVQAWLRPGRWLLHYTVTPFDAYVFLVPPAGQEVRAFPLAWPDGRRVDADTLAAAVEAVRADMRREAHVRGPMLEEPEPPPAGAAHRAHDLFRAVMPARVWEAVQEAEVLYLVPDGDLQRLPFEALVVRDPGEGDPSPAERRFWIDEGGGPPLVYGPSATVLVNRSEARTAQREARAGEARPGPEAVLLGNPRFAAPPEVEGPRPVRGLAVTALEAGALGERLGLEPGAVLLRYGTADLPSIEAFDAAAAALFSKSRRGELLETPSLVVWRRGATFARAVDPREHLGVTLRPVGEVDLDALLGGTDGAAPGDALRAAPRLDRLTPLPATATEVLTVARALRGGAGAAGGRGDVIVLLGEDATLAGLYEAAAGTRYLHLATHGLVDPAGSGLDAALALTLPPDATRDDPGMLTLLDLLERWWGRLGRTELVVLSACDTGQGRLRRGEGVFGLTWGFMYAGATAVVSSLWPVADASTATLMGDFYARLRALDDVGDDGPRTLRAFVAARRSLRAERPAPFFWAPFVYAGDPR